MIRTCEIIQTQVQLPKDFGHGHLVQTSSAATHSVRYRGIVMRGANLRENPKTEGGGNTMSRRPKLAFCSHYFLNALPPHAASCFQGHCQSIPASWRVLGRMSHCRGWRSQPCTSHAVALYGNHSQTQRFPHRAAHVITSSRACSGGQ